MNRLEALCMPRIKLLNHILAIDLVHNYVEFVYFGKDAHLKLSTPRSTKAHQIDILVNVHVILNE